MRVLLPLNSLLWEGDSLRLAGRTSVYTLICYRVYGRGAENRTQTYGFRDRSAYLYTTPQYIMTLGWSAAHTSYTNFCSLSFYNYIISNYFKSFNYAHELRQQEHQLPEMPHSLQGTHHYDNRSCDQYFHWLYDKLPQQPYTAASLLRNA